jgi:hypothetical protein
MITEVHAESFTHFLFDIRSPVQRFCWQRIWCFAPVRVDDRLGYP